MRINIYQLDSDKDENRVKFCNYDFTQQHGGVLPQSYKCVFHGDVDGNLEDVFTLFNTPEHPGTYQGHSLSVSDVIEVVGENEKGITPGSYFTDSFGFKSIDFDSSRCAEMDGIRMLMIQPHKTPVVTYVKQDLSSLQRAVSDHCEEAFIEYTYLRSKKTFSSQEIDQLLNMIRFNLIQMKMTEPGNENSLNRGFIKQICGGRNILLLSCQINGTEISK